MKLAIKEYWENLKTEYEATYNASIFSDYDILKQCTERFRTYLRVLMHEHLHDVDVVCALATVEQVLRHEENPIHQGFAKPDSETKRKVFFVTVRYNSPSHSRHSIQGRVVCSKC